METKQTRRAGRCGYRFDGVIRRQCRAKSKTLVEIVLRQITPVYGRYDLGAVGEVKKWQFRCTNHRKEKYLGN